MGSRSLLLTRVTTMLLHGSLSWDRGAGEGPDGWTSEYPSGTHGGQPSRCPACSEHRSAGGRSTVSGRTELGPHRTHCQPRPVRPGSGRRTEERPLAAMHSRLRCNLHAAQLLPHAGRLSAAMGPRRQQKGRAGLGWGLLQVQARRGTSLRLTGPIPVQLAFRPQGTCPAVRMLTSLHTVPNVLKPACHDPRSGGCEARGRPSGPRQGHGVRQAASGGAPGQPRAANLLRAQTTSEARS